MVDERGVGEGPLLSARLAVRGLGLVRSFVCIAATIVMFATLPQSVAVAQVQSEAARDHYRRGTAAYNLGKYAEAAREYELSYEATLDPALLFNVGQAYRLAGDRKKALTAYRSYVRSAPEGEKRELAEARIKEIETALNYEDPFMNDDRAPPRARTPAPIVAAPAPATTPVPPPAASPEPLAVAALPIPRSVVPIVSDEPSAATTTLRSEPAPAVQREPIYNNWWFWAGSGALVIGVIVIVLVAASGGSGPSAPQTDLGTMRF